MTDHVIREGAAIDTADGLECAECHAPILAVTGDKFLGFPDGWLCQRCREPYLASGPPWVPLAEWLAR